MQASFVQTLGSLQELQSESIRAAHVHELQSCAISGSDRLNRTERRPAGLGDTTDDVGNVLDKKGHVNRSDITRARPINLLVRRCDVLEQLDAMPRPFHHGQLQDSAFDTDKLLY